jgi:hypothetical protein
LAQLNPQSGQESRDPFQLLAELGGDAMAMLISSREVSGRQAQGPENRILVHPREASALRHWLRDPMPNLFLDYHPKLLESHAISEPAARALRAGEPAEFLRLRREAIVTLERTFVESLGLELTGD